MAAGGVMPAVHVQASVRVATLAVFIDADNLNEPTALDHVLTDLRQRADRVLYKRAYGRPESLKGIESVLSRHGVRPVANMVVNKVTTDSALVIDAVEAACTNRIEAVAICSGDADFVPLATWLREKGSLVWCFSLADRIFANPESFYDDVAVLEVIEPVTEPAVAVDDVAAIVQQLPQSAATSLVVAPAQASVHSKPPADMTEQVLKVFHALRDGQPQHLNQVVAALRQAGVVTQSTKTVAWFRQHAAAFRLYPDPAPNRIAYMAATVLPRPTPAPGASSQGGVAKVDTALEKATVLRRNTQLIGLLRKAVLAAQDGSGWATVSAVRLQLGGKASFDVRAYGCSTLTKLLEASGAFDLRCAGTPQVAARVSLQSDPHAVVATPSAAAAAVMTWPSTHGRRASMPLPVPLHGLRAVSLQLAAQRVERADVLKAVPELATGTLCALSAVAGRLRERGQLHRSQSALRIFERFPRHFEVSLDRHPQTVRQLGYGGL